MSSSSTSAEHFGGAEADFRAAFERLKAGQPRILPKGTPVSQNNVAKEAGRDPSALKKDRYPALIAEIQLWIQQRNAKARTSPTPRQELKAARNRSAELAVQIERLTCDRDLAQSLLVSAQKELLDLWLEVQSFRAAAVANVERLPARVRKVPGT